jgi:hypothetical protein
MWNRFKRNPATIGSEQQDAAQDVFSLSDFPAELVQHVAGYLTYGEAKRLALASRFFHSTLDRAFFKKMPELDNIFRAVRKGIMLHEQKNKVREPGYKAQWDIEGFFLDFAKGASMMPMCAHPGASVYYTARAEAEIRARKERSEKKEIAYNATYHQLLCFAHIIFNETLSLPIRFLAILELTKQFSTPKEVLGSGIDVVNVYLDKVFDKNTLKMMTTTLKRFMSNSYDAHYKQNDYGSNAGEAYWSTVLKKFSQQFESQEKEREMQQTEEERKKICLVM